MAESSTARIELIKYSAGTDQFSRADWNTVADKLELYVTRDEQGNFASRPVAGIRGRNYYDTTNGVLWRDTGSAWINSNLRDTVVKSSAIGIVSFTAQAITSQTADIVQVLGQSGNTYLTMGPTGDWATRDNRLLQRTNPGTDVYTTEFTTTGNNAKLVALIMSDTNTKPFLEAKHTTGAVIYGISTLGGVTAATETITDTTTVALATPLPPLMIGPFGSTNMAMGPARLQARNNGAGSTLGLNDLGGAVNVGHSSSTVTVAGMLVAATATIGTSRIWIQSAAPTLGTVDGDIWIKNNASPSISARVAGAWVAM